MAEKTRKTEDTKPTLERLDTILDKLENEIEESKRQREKIEENVSKD